MRRARSALLAAGGEDNVVALAETARSAEDAAQAIGCALGQIVKTLVFRDGGRAVLALIAGDRRGDPVAIGAALGLARKPGRADADFVKQATGFSIGGVAPVGLAAPALTVMDGSLWRFDQVHAAAGHPHCVFAASPDSLLRIAGARRAEDIALPL